MKNSFSIVKYSLEKGVIKNKYLNKRIKNKGIKYTYRENLGSKFSLKQVSLKWRCSW